jgi:putative membrane protein
VPDVTAGDADAVAPDIPDLGAMRTMMAADRTMMAWIRTSLAMLSFGYTIYKVLQEVQEAEQIALHGNAPRNAGALLSIMGTAALIMGLIEYCGNLRVLRRIHAFQRARPALIMAVAMAVAGMMLSLGIMTKLL